MIRLFLNIKIAFRSLSNFKLRTALAMLGAFLGTFSLVVVSNLSESLAKKTEIEISKLGENLLIVRSGLVRRVSTATNLIGEATTLTIEDAIAIKESSPLIEDVAPSANKVFPVRYQHLTLNSVLVMGVTPEYTEVRNFKVERGSFFSDDDNNNLQKVAVIGRKVAEKLFGDEDPLGKNILIFRVPCQIIGILEEKGVDISGFDQDNQIFVPLNTFLKAFVNKRYINNISVKVVDRDATSQVKMEITNILRKRHKITGDKKDDFTVIDLKDVVALSTQAMDMIKILGRIASLISFIIGGLGILSIMVLIVNERKIEIGIRRALGARKRDIMLQFLIESSTISWVGGTAGLFLSIFASLMIFYFAALPIAISLFGLAITLVATILIGMLAGLYPAKKAIEIQPVSIIKG
ncbi:MAG: ABC transporter permease [Thermodesulfovibrionales bacterium]|nr:ABC transporter permease [Thermodesulfovibrionales bacterium]